jgi:phage FluMu protein Com
MVSHTVIKCTNCNKRLGVPKGLHIIFICPFCSVKQELFFTNVYTPMKPKVDNDKGNIPMGFEIWKNMKRNKHHFSIILN